VTAHGGGVLRALADDLWVADQPLRFAGLEVGTRMTVIRLPGGGLLLHSPVARSAELAAADERLGTPAVIVAPKRLHHLYVQEWSLAAPASRVLVAPGLDEKRPDLKVDGVLGDAAPPEWGGVLEHALVAGAPFVNEVVLFHRPSATLVTSDLLFNVGDESPALTRFAFKLFGAYGRPAVTPLERLVIRDRPAYVRSLERILSWPFERVVVAHGSVVERGGRAAVASAYAWLLGNDAAASRASSAPRA
jgi:hypothetical protein